MPHGKKAASKNANGRLRRWLPRHLDIDRTSDQDIREIVLTTNLTPANASGSRRHSKPSLPSLESTFKSASLKRVALRSGIQKQRSVRAAFPVITWLSSHKRTYRPRCALLLQTLPGFGPPRVKPAVLSQSTANRPYLWDNLT